METLIAGYTHPFIEFDSLARFFNASLFLAKV
jgi:hypothetical protein